MQVTKNSAILYSVCWQLRSHALYS